MEQLRINKYRCQDQPDGRGILRFKERVKGECWLRSTFLKL
jgi:hypothetical protein